MVTVFLHAIVVCEDGRKKYSPLFVLIVDKIRTKDVELDHAGLAPVLPDPDEYVVAELKELEQEYDGHAQVEAEPAADAGHDGVPGELLGLDNLPHVQGLEVDVRLKVVLLDLLLELGVVQGVEDVLGLEAHREGEVGLQPERQDSSYDKIGGR